MKTKAPISRATTTAPTPIPAFAPTGMELSVGGIDHGEDVDIDAWVAAPDRIIDVDRVEVKACVDAGLEVEVEPETASVVKVGSWPAKKDIFPPDTMGTRPMLVRVGLAVNSGVWPLQVQVVLILVR